MTGPTDDDWEVLRSADLAGSWSTTFDFVMNNEVLALLHPRVSALSASAHRAAVLIDRLMSDAPRAPVKRRGCTGKRYRIARRRYGRALRAWRRAGSPHHPVRLYFPSVEVQLCDDAA